MAVPYIFNIQKFSLHDGPGIRTTVFFKGCPMRCLWCHNPESQRFHAEKMFQDNGREVNVGRQYTIPQLIEILRADELFYDQSGGGITLSGGEVMCQDMDYIIDLLKEINYHGLSVAIDTCGYAAQENFQRVLPFTDLFLYDLKTVNEDIHLQYTGVSNRLILNNLRYLSSQGANIDLRLIIIPDVNADMNAITETHRWLHANNVKPKRITLLPYHDFGKNKYNKLSRTCTQNFRIPDKDLLMRISQQFQDYGYNVQINS